MKGLNPSRLQEHGLETMVTKFLERRRRRFVELKRFEFCDESLRRSSQVVERRRYKFATINRLDTPLATPHLYDCSRANC
jgi:hypothetical protein